MAKENLISTKEYAKLCGVSETTVRNRIYMGYISAKRKGGYIFIDADKFPPQPKGEGGRPNAEKIKAGKSDVFLTPKI